MDYLHEIDELQTKLKCKKLKSTPAITQSRLEQVIKLPFFLVRMAHIKKMSVLLKVIYGFNTYFLNAKKIVCKIRLDGSKVHIDKQIGRISQ